jgi:hypothetical protein
MQLGFYIQCMFCNVVNIVFQNNLFLLNIKKYFNFFIFNINTLKLLKNIKKI